MNGKIGILTFHGANNQGAVLQCYALQHTLENRFRKSTEIINYYCPSVEDVHIPHNVKGLALRIYYRIKAQGFNRFRKQYFHLSPRFSADTINKAGNRYRAIIAGSDQIWNYECSGWDDTYFLDFITTNTKKYAFAASVGNYCFSEEEKSKVGRLLDGFNSISVREKSAKEQLSEITKVPVLLLPDPVLLLDSQNWQKIMSPKLLKKRYVFVYLIQPAVRVMQAAERYAKENGLRIICNKNSPEFIAKGSPSDFLSWIYHAECVFSNSFHGTVFSLIFGKKLGAEIELRNGSVNCRIQEILEDTNNTACILRSINAEPAQTNPVISIEKKIKEAMSFLEKV